MAQSKKSGQNAPCKLEKGTSAKLSAEACNMSGRPGSTQFKPNPKSSEPMVRTRKLYHMAVPVFCCTADSTTMACAAKDMVPKMVISRAVSSRVEMTATQEYTLIK